MPPKTVMSILTSHYMDDDGIDGPTFRTLRVNHQHPYREDSRGLLRQHSTRRTSLDQHSDAWSFPRIKHDTEKRSGMGMANYGGMRSLFTSQDLKAIANVLLKAPVKVQQEHSKQTDRSCTYEKEQASRFVSDVARSLRPNSARTTAKDEARQDKNRHEKTQRSFSAGERLESAIDPAWEVEEALPFPRSRAQGHERSPSKKEPSYHPQTLQQMPLPQGRPPFRRASIDFHGPVQNIPYLEQHVADKPTATLSRKEKKAEKKAQQAAAKNQQKELAKRNASPSANHKVTSWNMDPRSIPASMANTGSGNDGEYGGIFDEGEANSYHGDKSRRSHESRDWGADNFGETRKSSSRRTHLSRPSQPLHLTSREPDSAGDAHRHPYISSEHNKNPSLRSRPSRHGSGSRHSDARNSRKTLKAIPESDLENAGTADMPGGQAKDEHASHANHESEQRSHRGSRGSRKSRDDIDDLVCNATQEESASRRISHPSSKSGSHRSHRSGAPASYVAPTVEDDPAENWGGWDRRSSSDRARSRADAKAGAERSRSRRSKSSEKVDEWFGSIPVPSEKAMSAAASHRSRSRGSEAAWKDGKVPSEASLGTGYARNRESPRGSWDGGEKGQVAWDAGSNTPSTMAEVGGKGSWAGSARSGRQSIRNDAGSRGGTNINVEW